LKLRIAQMTQMMSQLRTTNTCDTRERADCDWGAHAARVLFFGRRPKTFHVADLNVVEITNSEFTRLRQPFGQRPERCTPAARAPQNCARICFSALSVSSVVQT
jgi:hypothetical protein